jgi:hypothetical protein
MRSCEGIRTSDLRSQPPAASRFSLYGFMRRSDKEKWRGRASRLSRTVGWRRLQPSGERNRSFNAGLANASNRPEGDLQDRLYERAGRARKRSSAEGVGCAVCSHRGRLGQRPEACRARSASTAAAGCVRGSDKWDGLNFNGCAASGLVRACATDRPEPSGRKPEGRSAPLSAEFSNRGGNLQCSIVETGARRR